MAIGDFDPEDEWDDGDAFEVKLAVLERIVASVLAEPNDDRRVARRGDAQRLLGKLARLIDVFDSRLDGVRDGLA